MNTKEQFTQRLTLALARSGLTWNALAERLSEGEERVYASTTTNWRDGAIPSGEMMMRLPGLLGVDGHWLLTGDGEMLRTAPDESAALLARVRELLGVGVMPPGGFRRIE